jgi:hypothetical protein
MMAETKPSAPIRAISMASCRDGASPHPMSGYSQQSCSAYGVAFVFLHAVQECGLFQGSTDSGKVKTVGVGVEGEERLLEWQVEHVHRLIK